MKTTLALPILNSLDAFQHFYAYFSWTQEEVHIVALNAGKVPVATELLFRGTADFCLFHPRDVFRFLFKHNASTFIIAHNHPSGDPTPSFQDILITKKLNQAARLFQIELIDHLILTEKSYVSLKELGLLNGKRKTDSNSF